MNHMLKIAVVGASILTMGALTACQSTTSQTKELDHPQKMRGDKHPQMTAEQREQFKQKRAERHEIMKQIKQACDNKAAGSAVQVKAGDTTIDGTCTMTFKPDHDAMKKMHDQQREQGDKNHGPMRGEMRGMNMQHDEPMTDAQRVELTKKFEQRLAERQAQQQAIAKACQGQADGKAIQIKMGTQTLDGKCEVRFKPTTPMTPPSANAPKKAA